MNVRFRSSRFTTLLAAALATAACSDSDPVAVTPQVIETAEFAPALGVDLSAMTRTASGMYVQTLEEGSGEMAATGSTVEVAYVGFLTTGVEFDSGTISPTLGVGQLISGFEEGLTGMRVGERRLIVIPPALAYGNRAVGLIPPGSILVFDLQVRSIS